MKNDKFKILRYISLKHYILFAVLVTLFSFGCTDTKKETPKFNFPADYLKEPEQIPSFWLSTVDEINEFLTTKVHKGEVKVIGKSAGGRPIRAVFYGQPRQGKGTSTYSGSRGFGNVGSYRGPDHDKTVYFGIAGVHGGEFEGMVGMVNLIAVIETGKDLKGKEWPSVASAISKVNRIVLIPIMNPDGRDRIPIRMELYRGKFANTVHEYLNTGGKKDSTLIGWPWCKEFIPLDFSTVGFPGGYPNDAGVNIMHDDFIGNPQPETKALFTLAALEKPDLVFNMHTGPAFDNYYVKMMRPAGFDSLYNRVNKELIINGLQDPDDIVKEPAQPRQQSSTLPCNLNSALNMLCGALGIVVEAPGHGFSGTNRQGMDVVQTPEMLVDAQIIIHQEAIRYLGDSGGLSKWSPAAKR
jgi:hypothetical protein